MYGTASGDLERRVQVERQGVDGAAVVLTLDRPKVYNAFDRALCAELVAAIDEAATSGAAVIVLRGAGGNFSVGGDIKEVQRLRTEGPDALVTMFDAFASVLDAVQRVDVPVVAAVEGYALAGGFELLQVCDVVLVTDDAVLGDHHVRAGQVPAGGGSQRLPRLVGRQRGLAHLLTGDRLDAETAVAWGLAYRSASAAAFPDLVDEVVGQLLALDATALRRIKSLVTRGLATTLADGLALERSVALDDGTWNSFSSGRSDTSDTSEGNRT